MIASELAKDDDFKKAILMGYIAQGLNNKQISEKFGVDDGTVGRWVKKFNLRIKKKKETISDEKTHDVTRTRDHLPKIDNFKDKIAEALTNMNENLILYKLYEIISDEDSERGDVLKAIQLVTPIAKEKGLFSRSDAISDKFNDEEFIRKLKEGDIDDPTADHTAESS